MMAHASGPCMNIPHMIIVPLTFGQHDMHDMYMYLQVIHQGTRCSLQQTAEARRGRGLWLFSTFAAMVGAREQCRQHCARLGDGMASPRDVVSRG